MAATILLGDLEFARVDHFSGSIGKVINVHAAVEIVQCNSSLFRKILCLVHFFTQETEDGNGTAFLLVFVKIKGDI